MIAQLCLLMLNKNIGMQAHRIHKNVCYRFEAQYDHQMPLIQILKKSSVKEGDLQDFPIRIKHWCII